VISKSVLPSRAPATDQSMSLLKPDQEVRVGIAKAESKVFNEEAEPEEETKGRRAGLAYENMLSVIEMTKDGPWWTHKEYVKDAEERRPENPDYDQSSLFIPPEEWELLTPGMQRYWENKMKNFDKILLYRFGHWFLVFFQDAERCNKLIDLHIPPKLNQTYLGFHEKWLEDYVDVLVTAGYKVAICEQIEDGEQMQVRIAHEMKDMSAEERRKVNKTVMREVHYIYSKGTHFKIDAD